MKDISMMFINANPLFNTVRPLRPTTINVGGGIHLLKPQPLPKCLVLYGLFHLFLRSSHSANILAFMPLPFYSHQVSVKPLWLELAKKGHKIVLIQPNVTVENNENITNIILDKTYDILNKYQLFEELAVGGSIIKVLATGAACFTEVLEYQVTHPEVQELLKGERKIDLFFTEILSTFALAIGSKLKVPMIGVVSMDATTGAHIALGNPTHPVLYADKDLVVSQERTYADRVLCTVYWLAYRLVDIFLLNRLQENTLNNIFGEEFDLREITKNISMMFINANPLFNDLRPLGRKTINIGGGLHLLKPKLLPKELQDYLDNAENGVIYFSLGSSITSGQLSHATKQVILQTFSQLPYKILWKSEEKPTETPNNVNVMKWVPQQDVLRHKNIKLFITQGGLQSMEEAIFNYVPMIALPFYGDQHGNAIKMVNKGFGLKLDYANLDVETFKNSILEVINNPRYRLRVKEMADLITDQPMTGLEKAVWWTEYVLRHGHTDHLKNQSVDMPWYQFLLLDVIGFILLTLLIIIYVFIKILKLLNWSVHKLYKQCVRRRKSKTN
ncbi:hypothetical protein NQ315_015583 [Exocentrus adspersus]|uniref:Glucuronosyltransferase n=1 Tax=Exocentrus adspersus TaxID=1586481 RepID=A0AAV8V9R5_9CUCU|nr:hypothetical protein NQ315_015583 [Exocentrus adspersus]